MATVTGLTADRMLAIEAASVVDGDIVNGHLILTKHDGTTIDAGVVLGPAGPPGPTGPSGAPAIPGEIKLWPGSTLPAQATYGHWVWADGAVYVSATYPKAAANIATQWRTFAGASDPGASNFRVPDLRGLVPAGMDAMPGGSRANRMTRAVAITIAAKTGEETHVITVAEAPTHNHGVTDPGHGHDGYEPNGPQWHSVPYGGIGTSNNDTRGPDGFDKNVNPAIVAAANQTGISIGNSGGGGAHENVQPTVFVPYIVKLDD